MGTGGVAAFSMVVRAVVFGAVLGAFPAPVQAVCNQGYVAPCTRLRCTGTSGCLAGRQLGCAIAIPCIQNTFVVDRILAGPLPAGAEVGVLYDGTDASGPFNDRKVLATSFGTTVLKAISNLTAPGAGQAAIVFAEGKQPGRVPAIWTPGADVVGTLLSGDVHFGITFWIMAGDFATQQTRAAFAVSAVNNAYFVERAGVIIDHVTINDARGDADTPPLLDGTSPTSTPYKTGIGFTATEINVYVIDTAIGLAIAGLNYNGEPVILLGRDTLTFPQILEHELGHAFVLWHVDVTAPAYNFENVMWPSITAHYLTEGQTFRMHFHPSSQLNVLGLRPGLTTFVCQEPATDDCPANSRRLWQDGSMPPN